MDDTTEEKLSTRFRLCITVMTVTRPLLHPSPDGLKEGGSGAGIRREASESLFIAVTPDMTACVCSCACTAPI